MQKEKCRDCVFEAIAEIVPYAIKWRCTICGYTTDCLKQGGDYIGKVEFRQSPGMEVDNMKCMICDKREAVYVHSCGMDKLCPTCLANIHRLLSEQYNKDEIWFDYRDIVKPMVDLVWVTTQSWFNYPAFIRNAEVLTQKLCEMFALVKEVSR